MTRILLFTGKGGVGKTTVAAATAARAAAQGCDVLITSTDPAHSLADAFDAPLGDDPVTVATNLHAQQIDAQARFERHWTHVRDYLVEVLAWGGLGEVQAEELVLLPGLDELFALIDLRRHVATGAHDVIVLDCAPTAETLRLLALPDALRFYVDRMVQPGRNLARAVRPVMDRVGGMPVPKDEVFGAVERLHRDLADVHDILQDGDRTSVRLVVNPERMVINEARRTATSLSLFGYAIDAVIVNRVLPDEISDPYLARWKELHDEHTATIRDTFAPLPVLTAPLFDDELIGTHGLGRLGETLYGARDATVRLHDDHPVTVEPVEDGYLLHLALPFTGADDVDLHRRRHELHVKVAGSKRTFVLPAALRRCDVTGARVADGELVIRFEARAPVGSR